VVGQPPPGTPKAGVPTPFTFTTTDANGLTTVVTSTFTPSVPTTIEPSLTFVATVLDYSQYLTSYAIKQQPQQNTNNESNGSPTPSPGWWGLLASAIISVVGGGLLVGA
jgi:hypothetical protein